MRVFLGIILFWLSIIGLCNFVKKRFKLKEYFSLPIVTAMLGVVMFLAGILNILKIASILILAVSIGYLIYSIIKKEITLSTLKDFFTNPQNIIIIIVFVYISILGSQMHLTRYDNFSHWGLIVKNMFINDALPNFDDLTIMFKGYQPGSASYIYYFGLLCGKTESSMIIANNYIVFSFITIMYSVVKKHKSIIKNLIPVLFYVFIMIVSNNFNELLVDGMLSAMSLAVFLILYEYRKNLKKATILTLPILVFQYLVKNTGIVLIFFNCLYLFYLIITTKQLKKGIKYLFSIGITLLMFLCVWQNHVTYAYGEEALNSKHSLTSANILTQVRDKGWDNIFSWTNSYIKHFVDVNNNKPIIVIISINIILILSIIFEKNKKERKKLIALTLAVDFLYVGYYGILGLMYILSMPWGEAVVFASYERYMSTILIIIIGILFIYYFLKKEQKNYVFILLSFLMVLSIGYKKDNLKVLIGKEPYVNTFVEQYDKEFKNLKVDPKKNYYIYAPSSLNDFGYLYHLSVYKLNAPYVNVLQNADQLSNDYIGTLIVLEPDENIASKINEYKWMENEKNVYTKK